MTPSAFRKLALAMPDAIEGAHGGHADFRAGAGGKVFATLGYPDAAWAVIKLSPEQQEMLVASAPEERRLGSARQHATAVGGRQHHDSEERADHGVAGRDGEEDEAE